MKINFERIKYSPFGKKAFFGSPMALIALTFGEIMSAIGMIACIKSGGYFYVYAALFTFILGACIYCEYRLISEKCFQMRLLSDMTDDEHNKLIYDYKKYKENNKITIGCPTEYGITLDEQICPWSIIEEIEFTPSKRIRRDHASDNLSTRLKIKVIYGKRKYTIIQDYYRYPTDLSEPIAEFIALIPEYTDREIKINNRYYHTIF